MHDDVIRWKHFSRYWPFVRGIHWSLVNSPHKGQWHGAWMFFFNLHLNKRLSKQLWGWWFEMPSRSLWCHCNGVKRLVISLIILIAHRPMLDRHLLHSQNWIMQKHIVALIVTHIELDHPIATLLHIDNVIHINLSKHDDIPCLAGECELKSGLCSVGEGWGLF